MVLVLVLPLTGWKIDPRFFGQSLSEVNIAIPTFDSHLKHVLRVTSLYVIEVAK